MTFHMSLKAAAIGCFLPGQDAQQCRLSASVCAQQAHVFAPLQVHLQSAKQRTFPKPFFQRADDQHIVSCWRYCVKRKADRGRVIGRRCFVP